MSRIVELVALVAMLWLCAACRAGPGPPGTALYAGGPAFTDAAAALTRLDPTTLADRADLPSVAVGVPERLPIWVMSRDGSTLVAFDQTFRLDPARTTTAVVTDVASGAERARFTLDEPVGPAYLSRDGRRLVVTPTVARGPGVAQPRSTWRVVDTAGGRVLARVELEGDGLPSWIDDGARRLYAAVQPRDEDGPRPLVLVGVDLESGARLGRLELPEVPNGMWTIRRPNASNAGAPYLVGVAIPGLALSPDGRHLAVVPPDADVLLWIDTQRMTVERRIPLARGAAEPWRWLPFWPRPAGAKGLEGTARQATFSADGTQLYVLDRENHLDDAGAQRPASHRLLRVDLARGAVATEWYPTEGIYDLQVSPEGRSLYLFQPAPNPESYSGCESPICPFVLRRLDAGSLAVLAERPIVGHRQLAVRPAR